MSSSPTPYQISWKKAAWTLNQLCLSLKLGSKAEHFDPNDRQWWDNIGTNHVIVRRDRVIIAEIEMLEGARRHVTIPRWDGLIRTEHLSEFNPRDHGLIENTSEDVLFHEKFPDSTGEVDFGDPPGLDLPLQPIIKETRYKRPRVVL